MRALLIAVALVVGMGGTAEARRGGGIVVINTGDQIVHIRDLDPELGATLGYTKLGYRYERFGLFWLDLWRWDGEFVVYEGTTYAPLSADDLAALGGASTPWRYHLPDGLLVVLAVGYFFLIGRRKRKVKTTYIMAGGFAVTALVFFIMGLTWEFMIPLAIALHHAFAAHSAAKHGEDEEVVDEPPAPRVSQPRVDSGRHAPVRASQPSPSIAVVVPPAMPVRPSQPIVVEPPPKAPLVAPIRPDDSVDGPKLLR